MNIAKLDMEQVGLHMALYVAQHVKEYDSKLGASLFSESYLLDFEELEDFIPNQYRHHFTHVEKFNGLSGTFEIGVQSFTVMLVVSENYHHAYFLWMQFNDMSGAEQTVNLKNFI